MNPESFMIRLAVGRFHAAIKCNVWGLCIPTALLAYLAILLRGRKMSSTNDSVAYIWCLSADQALRVGSDIWYKQHHISDVHI